jgi:hypothetical protein
MNGIFRAKRRQTHGGGAGQQDNTLSGLQKEGRSAALCRKQCFVDKLRLPGSEFPEASKFNIFLIRPDRRGSLFAERTAPTGRWTSSSCQSGNR